MDTQKLVPPKTSERFGNRRKYWGATFQSFQDSFFLYFFSMCSFWTLVLACWLAWLWFCPLNLFCSSCNIVFFDLWSLPFYWIHSSTFLWILALYIDSNSLFLLLFALQLQFGLVRMTFWHSFDSLVVHLSCSSARIPWFCMDLWVSWICLLWGVFG